TRGERLVHEHAQISGAGWDELAKVSRLALGIGVEVADGDGVLFRPIARADDPIAERCDLGKAHEVELLVVDCVRVATWKSKPLASRTSNDGSGRPCRGCRVHQ